MKKMQDIKCRDCKYLFTKKSSLYSNVNVYCGNYGIPLEEEELDDAVVDCPYLTKEELSDIYGETYYQYLQTEVL